MFAYRVESNLQEFAETLPEQPPFIFDEQGMRSLNATSETRRMETRATYTLLHRLLCEKRMIASDARPQIAHHEHGKPYLADYPHIYFNLSHCRRGIVAAISTDGEIGIDIESRRRVSSSLLHKVCSDEEITSINAATDPEIEFLRLWTIKEALLKKIGTGIDRDLRSLLRADNPILQGLTLESIAQPQMDGYLSLCY